MKTIILCGGLGTRLMEETVKIPKPLVKIGQKPIVWHIIKLYQYYGFTNFILAGGYKQNLLQNYFKKNPVHGCEIKVVNTGLGTLTGGRLLRLKKYFNKNENFMMTYGDGLSNINIEKLVKFHLKHKKIATMTAVRPPVRFGEIELNNNQVSSFKEKNQSSKNWINGGFFVLNYKIFNFIKNDKTIFEKKPIINLTKKKQIYAFKHYKFWQCMDTLRDKIFLSSKWNCGQALWKIW
jgi:glucose-1-phosphate cytidylyltransferase